MHATGAEHPMRRPCREVPTHVAEERLEGVTSAEVIQEILHRFPRSPRDLIHVATCLAHGIGVIVSPDADLDRVEEIRRLAPEDRGALAPYLR